MNTTIARGSNASESNMNYLILMSSQAELYQR